MRYKNIFRSKDKATFSDCFLVLGLLIPHHVYANPFAAQEANSQRVINSIAALVLTAGAGIVVGGIILSCGVICCFPCCTPCCTLLLLSLAAVVMGVAPIIAFNGISDPFY